MSAGTDQLRALLVDVAAGQTSALERLYRLTSAKLFGVCLRLCRDRGGAEEALQDAYVKIWRKAAAFDPARASPITWMCTIARNTAIDWCRANPLARAGDEADDSEMADTGETAIDPEAALMASGERHHILDCVRRLEPNQARAVRNAFYDGLTHSELAVRMNVPLGTLKSWIRRAMISLRKCVDDAG